MLWSSVLATTPITNIYPSKTARSKIRAANCAPPKLLLRAPFGVLRYSMALISLPSYRL